MCESTTTNSNSATNTVQAIVELIEQYKQERNELGRLIDVLIAEDDDEKCTEEEYQKEMAGYRQRIESMSQSLIESIRELI